MDDVHKQEFQVRDLDTRTVTLFPARAQITRGIEAKLQPGTNEIVIVGLSPTVDEQSIKVEGTGSAIITNIAIESQPNRDSFQDIYPESEESDDDSNSDQEDDDANAIDDDPAKKATEKRISDVLDGIKRAKETVLSAESRLKILDSYGTMMTSLPPGATGYPTDLKISGSLETYRSERERIYQDHVKGNATERELSAQLTSLTKERSRLEEIARKKRAQAQKIKAKAERAKLKEREKNARKREKEAREKYRIRQERESFWPKKVFVIKISLEVATSSPLNSRRGSVSSDLVEIASEASETAQEAEVLKTCDLNLTYVTSYAYWSPSYDLALSTTTSAGTLCFDAQLTNMTSETWSNAKVILSTSQADFSGLNDKIPTLVPWRVRLARETGASFHTTTKVLTGITYSREEQSQKSSWTSQQHARSTQKPRADIFGLDDFEIPRAPIRKHKKSTAWEDTTLRYQEAQQARQQPAHAGGLFAAPPPPVHPSGGGLFGASRAGPQRSVGGVFGSGPSFGSSAPEPVQVDEKDKTNLSPEELRFMSDITDDMEQAPQELDFQESSFEETGFTSTYELPSSKTIEPSSVASKQRVARIKFSSIAFSHTVVAKYKPAAYLKAKVRNGSKLTLLRGPTSLTLDGSFMGRTHLPRCSPGDSFTLSLGVDPAIRVAYPKPDVKRSQSGLFSKEDSSAYKRLVTIDNTRSGDKAKSVQITVLDQVPVSEDEKLRIEVLRPLGLVLGSSPVIAGVSGREGKEHADWGNATAKLIKGGEVVWDLKLKPGRMVKLALEYECSIPAGEHAVNV